MQTIILACIKEDYGVLTVDGLSSTYSSSKGPVYAVDDVDFDLESGKSIGIAGESACGRALWAYL